MQVSVLVHHKVQMADYWLGQNAEICFGSFKIREVSKKDDVVI